MAEQPPGDMDVEAALGCVGDETVGQVWGAVAEA
jgi:hypothetical protein